MERGSGLGVTTALSMKDTPSTIRQDVPTSVTGVELEVDIDSILFKLLGCSISQCGLWTNKKRVRFIKVVLPKVDICYSSTVTPHSCISSLLQTLVK